MADETDLLLLPIHENDHARGPASAALTMVEYGDYECPGCGRAFVTLEKFFAELGDGLRLVYRHYPYGKLHPNAAKAAEAAEAAGAQGKFWQMHDTLFQNQSALEVKHLVEYAGRLDLDVDRFRQELKRGTYTERWRSDFRSGVQNGVFKTPCIFINGVRHNGNYDEASLREAAGLAR